MKLENQLNTHGNHI